MKVDLSKVEKLYTDNIKEYGIDAKSVGWGTKEKQDLRFEKLMGVVLDRDSDLSINELGCGYGELVNFCKEKNMKISKYFGYDLSSEMIKAANNYIGGPNVKLFQSRVLKTKADYTIASGIFNVKFDERKENWEIYIFDTIKHIYDNSMKGISFNFLSKYVDWEKKDLYYADPTLIFNFCKANLSEKVNLIHDYNLFEFTIHVLK
jgi:SAM-dependent methyltransferase